ncbi:hypothetical protein OHS70_17590 [Streptomyces sp. NBC_00390]|uniref:hypothetical protein n=1 Tax=Streptomyces sp. NBC_00390 TaxID=2975736 RepID=UPI002E222D51
MGFSSAWAITAHTDEVMAELLPRVRPLITRQQLQEDTRREWRAWCADPLPDHRQWDPLWRDPERGRALMGFLRLTSAAPLDELHSGDCTFDLYDVWEQAADEVRPWFGIHCKEYAVSALFHAIGLRRAALLPGWCGDFALDAQDVRGSLPAVERALTFTPRERAAAEVRIWLDEGPEDESVLDGPLRCWQQAAEAGLGLLGASVHLC